MKLIASVFVALMLAGSASAAAVTKPSVRVLPGDTSVGIAGKGFKSGEKISVLVFHSGVKVVKRVTASASGAFRFSVSVAAVDLCTFSYVTAKGDQGSKASVRNMPAPCGPPIVP